jgi:hypothetical protein
MELSSGPTRRDELSPLTGLDVSGVRVTGRPIPMATVTGNGAERRDPGSTSRLDTNRDAAVPRVHTHTRTQRSRATLSVSNAMKLRKACCTEPRLRSITLRLWLQAADSCHRGALAGA